MRRIFQRVCQFVRQEKYWWLVSLLVCLLILGALVYFTQSPQPLSPYMYNSR